MNYLKENIINTRISLINETRLIRNLEKLFSEVLIPKNQRISTNKKGISGMIET